MTKITEATLPRRTVVMGAAWAAPVIAMAVATPMAAASGEPTSSLKDARLRWDTWRNNYTDNGSGVVISVRTGIQIQNNYWADDSSSLVSKPASVVLVNITYPAGVVTDNSPSAATLSGEGWTLSSVKANPDGSVTYTLLYGPSISASQSSAEANLVVPAKRVANAQASATCMAVNAELVGAPNWGNPIY